MPSGKIQSLFLGDSYTAGTAVPENLRWPVQLASRIKELGVDIEAPRFIAGNGWTTADLMHALEVEDPPPEFDFVFLLIGVNNQFQGRPLSEFEEHLSFLLDRATQLARGRADGVFVLTIPDYSVTPFAADQDPEEIASEITRFNNACVTRAAERNVPVLDIVGMSRQAADDRALLVSDGLHPSEEMYRLWSDFVFAQLRERL